MSSQNRVEFNSSQESCRTPHPSGPILGTKSGYKFVFEYIIQFLQFYHHFLDLGGLIAEGASAVQAKGRHGLSLAGPPYWRTDKWYPNPGGFAQSPCNFIMCRTVTL